MPEKDKKRILLVEDDATISDLVAYNLRRAGYNAGFTPLETAVERYVQDFLDRPDRYR